ncbi:hypothetical protein GGR56DRAFT_668687 [Xylariaceae sp. FL0804]|nr:hypothetical protein GGR56DRAFT_668687 [Xylariaceae sp. FL0804]
MAANHVPDHRRAFQLDRVLTDLASTTARLDDGTVHVALNAYNLRTRDNVRRGAWTYFHPIRELPARDLEDFDAGPAPVPAISIPDAVRRDLARPWHSVRTHRDRNGVGAPARYRYAVFIHRHRLRHLGHRDDPRRRAPTHTQQASSPAQAATDVYSMTVWDRETRSLTWSDTGLRLHPPVAGLDPASRWAEVRNFWRRVGRPAGNVIPTAAFDAFLAANGGGGVPNPTMTARPHANVYGGFNALACAARTRPVCWRSLFTIMAWATEAAGGAGSWRGRWALPGGQGLLAVGPDGVVAHPRRAFDDAQAGVGGLARAALPRLFAAAFRALYCNSGGGGGGGSGDLLYHWQQLRDEEWVRERYATDRNELFTRHLRAELAEMRESEHGLPSWAAEAICGPDPDEEEEDDDYDDDDDEE